MSTRSRVACVALAAALGLASCEGGLFAPAAPLPPRLELALAATAATDSAAFEGLDAIRIRVGRQLTGVLLDSTFAFRSAGAETRVRVPVEIASSQEAVTVDVELRTAGQTIFVGRAGATLTRGQTTAVPIALTRVLVVVASAIAQPAPEPPRADASRPRAGTD